MTSALRYVLHEKLGAGGMGVVYRGTMLTPVGEREVAIKQLADRTDIDSRGRERLIAEAQLVFRLTHTNVCQVIDLGEGDEGTFVVLEYVRGCDLRSLIRYLQDRSEPLAIAVGVYIARELARALDYAHRKTDDRGVALSLWHGDVTPQNTLLSVEGEVKLTDFGIARALGIAAPGSGLRGGTPGFVAPEAERGAGDHRSDIYGLGMSLAVALTGRPAKEVASQRASLGRMRADLSADLCATLARAVEPDPQQRFMSAFDLERALSLELARRDPMFTPSVLAGLVRDCAPVTPSPASTHSEPPSKATTIFSMVPTQSQSPIVASTRKPRTLTADSAPSEPTARGSFVPADGPTRSSRRILPAVLALLVATGGIWAAARRHFSATTGASDDRAARPTASVAPSNIAVTPIAAPSPIAPDPGAARDAAGAGHHSQTRRPGKPGVGNGYATVTALPWALVYIDGHRVADETPLYHYALPSGEHLVRVRFPNDAQLSPPRKIRVEPGQTLTIGFTR